MPTYIVAGDSGDVPWSYKIVRQYPGSSPEWGIYAAADSDVAAQLIATLLNADQED